MVGGTNRGPGIVTQGRQREIGRGGGDDWSPPFLLPVYETFDIAVEDVLDVLEDAGGDGRGVLVTAPGSDALVDGGKHLVDSHGVDVHMVGPGLDVIEALLLDGVDELITDAVGEELGPLVWVVGEGEDGVAYDVRGCEACLPRYAVEGLEGWGVEVE